MKYFLFAAVFALYVCSTQAKDLCQVVKDSTFWAGATKEEIVDATTGGNKIGECFIQDNRGTTGFCDLYAKSAIIGVDGDRGWPKNMGNRGTGCVRAPDLPKRVTTCFFRNSEYDLPDSLVATFCTNDGFGNAVAQIRHAIRNDACALRAQPETCQPPDRGCVCKASGFKQKYVMCKKALALTKKALKRSNRALKKCRRSCK